MGQPNRCEIAFFPVYGSNSSTQVIGTTDIGTPVMDSFCGNGTSSRQVQLLAEGALVLDISGRESQVASRRNKCEETNAKPRTLMDKCLDSD